MTIKETVMEALYAMPGNNFTNMQVVTWLNHFRPNPNETMLTSDQIRRALRDMKCVRRVNGRYIRKGRRVPNVKATAVEA